MVATEKCDVYSFGVVALEVIMGKHPGELISSLPTMSTDDLLLANVGDRRILPPSSLVEKLAHSILNVSRACLNYNPQERPTMRQVTELLWPPKETFRRLLPHVRGLGFKPRREGFPSGAKKKWGLSPKMKVDFEKAFDYVKWDYLDETLKAFGFGSKWRNWISSCLNNAIGLVLVNSSPTLEFQFHKGLNSNVVAAAASLIGCSILTAPFNYLGVKVGSNISRITSWDDVISKVPIGVLNHLESIRRNFFYGVDGLERKLAWIGWNMVLTSKKNGVKSSRILIDNTILPKAEFLTRWLRVVPIKVNVHAWRVCLDKLPTRANLSLRGMDIPSIVCPLCNSAVESSSHIFLPCPLARQVWRKFLIWWELEDVVFNSYNEWLNWIVNIRLHKQLKVFLKVDLEPDEWIKDIGCSKHMMGNRKLFSRYKAYNRGNVIFGRNLRGQICDNTCRLTFFEHDSKITKDGKVIASKELVRNLPKLKFDQHFCDACKIGKQAHASHRATNIVSTTRCLELLHMDLFGLSTIRSYEEDRYTLVIVDDYS
nr:probable leucine-rich repeat receptor-like protein kinase At1g35710 [Tanacetum cinerariifolium]